MSAADTSAAPAVCVLTLGCAKNEVDSDKMRAALLAGGMRITDEVAGADVVIVNTCAFLASAVEEGVELILDVAEEVEDAGGRAALVVAGCMPSRYGEKLQAELPEVDRFVRADDEESIVGVVRELTRPRSASAEGRGEVLPDRTRHEVGPFAYVKISEGCDRRCTYCAIPAIRGPHESRSFDDIASEVGELADAGAREIVLIAQDSGAWGRDLDVPSTTARLVTGLAERWPDVWFRLLYVQPDAVTDELLDAIATHENICPYLDIPLQHASGDVLACMGRKGSAETFAALLGRIRRRIPDIALRTTFMAGFPGESEEDFEELLDFVDEAAFDFAGIFAYSREEGTPSASLEGHLDAEVKLSRAQQLLDAAESVGCAQVRRFIGRDMDVLVEGHEQSDVGLEALCRSRYQAPEVDGQVHVPIDDVQQAPVGAILHVRVTDTFFFEWEAELCE